MKDDAVIKDNEAVYLLNEQTYLHLRGNLCHLFMSVPFIKDIDHCCSLLIG